MDGTERGLFGKIDTYGWGEARLIRQDQYVWLGRAVENKPPPEGCTLQIGIPWLIDRNTEIALSVRRNYSIRASILLYRRVERRLAGRSFGEEGYVDPACIRIARGE